MEETLIKLGHLDGFGAVIKPGRSGTQPKKDRVEIVYGRSSE